MIFGYLDWFLLFVFILSLPILYIWNKHQCFKRQGINYLKPVPIFGNILKVILGKEHAVALGEHANEQYPDDKYVGAFNFHQPIVIIKDLEIIKMIMVKDFDHFVDHPKFTDEEVDPMLGRNLFFLGGEKWREMRTTLSPAFTSSKIRGMLPLMEECGNSLVEFLNKELEQASSKMLGYKEYDVKDLMGHLTNDVIASCAFGCKLNSLENDKNDFYTLAKDFTTISTIDNAKLFLYFFLPSVIKFFKIQLGNESSTDYFRNLVVKTIKKREEQNIIRPDMIHLLMLAKKGSLQDDEDNMDDYLHGQGKERPKKTKWTDEDLTAQALIFLFAGLDSTSNAISGLFHRLAIASDVQTKLQKEIDDYFEKSNGKIEYSELNKLKYLDMVVSESLRLWPPVPILDRLCVRPYTLPPQNDYGGKKFKVTADGTCNKGDNIWIPSYVIHRDPKHFPDPLEFLPERFSDENKSSIKPFAYMPFGHGPRQCIGSRFALLEIKIITVLVLKHFDLIVTSKTDTHKNVNVEPHFFAMIPEKGFWIGIKKRNFK